MPTPGSIEASQASARGGVVPVEITDSHSGVSAAGLFDLSAPRADIRSLLGYGARWSEAQRLTWPIVRAGCVVFANTKSKRVRSVPISQELQDRLEVYFAKKDRFPSCREAFARMVKRCISSCRAEGDPWAHVP